MIYPNWLANDDEFSVIYSIEEVLRRANLKFKIHDRGIPMTSDMWGGMMPDLVGRLRRFGNWKRKGVTRVIVFYAPQYYARNQHTVGLMDPLHMYHVVKYSAIRD